VDESCKAPKADLPLGSNLDCKDCFLGASAKLFYDLDFKFPHLHSVAAGFKDVQLKGALEVQAKQTNKSSEPSGKKVIRDGSFVSIIDKHIACPVCVRVHVKVAMPTEVDYSLSVSGSADFTAGAKLDIELGDSFIGWSKEHGWKRTSAHKSVSIVPSLIGTLDAEADLKLGVTSSLQLGIDGVMWSHMDLAASLPATVKLHKKFLSEFLSRKTSVCLDAKAGFTVSHEADLHATLFNKTVPQHWGPGQDFSKALSLNKCIDGPAPGAMEVVV
jgi:hypothetical protein